MKPFVYEYSPAPQKGRWDGNYCKMVAEVQKKVKGIFSLCCESNPGYN